MKSGVWQSWDEFDMSISDSDGAARRGYSQALRRCGGVAGPGLTTRRAIAKTPQASAPVAGAVCRALPARRRFRSTTPGLVTRSDRAPGRCASDCPNGRNPSMGSDPLTSPLQATLRSRLIRRALWPSRWRWVRPMPMQTGRLGDLKRAIWRETLDAARSQGRVFTELLTAEALIGTAHVFANATGLSAAHRILGEVAPSRSVRRRSC